MKTLQNHLISSLTTFLIVNFVCMAPVAAAYGEPNLVDRQLPRLLKTRGTFELFRVTSPFGILDVRPNMLEGDRRNTRNCPSLIALRYRPADMSSETGYQGALSLELRALNSGSFFRALEYFQPSIPIAYYPATSEEAGWQGYNRPRSTDSFFFQMIPESPGDYMAGKYFNGTGRQTILSRGESIIQIAVPDGLVCEYRRAQSLPFVFCATHSPEWTTQQRYFLYRDTNSGGITEQLSFRQQRNAGSSNHKVAAYKVAQVSDRGFSVQKSSAGFEQVDNWERRFLWPQDGSDVTVDGEMGVSCWAPQLN